ncbi:hypothetical protein ACFVYV_03500 [Streptomyces mirabilis]|jgi:hypothetical protein|uniref:hypothetical protein n=1 Tax=Streptomyces mirabilis TaxID=68239 RepID=UPI0036DB004E
MTTTRATEVPSEGEGDLAPSLGELLLKSTATLRERVAVQALVEEERIFTLDRVRSALISRAGDGTMQCDWDRMLGRLYSLGLNDEERAFLGLVLSIVGPSQTSLVRVMQLDERRLAIILRAMVRLSSCDTIAVGTRI